MPETETNTLSVMYATNEGSWVEDEVSSYVKTDSDGNQTTVEVKTVRDFKNYLISQHGFSRSDLFDGPQTIMNLVRNVNDNAELVPRSASDDKCWLSFQRYDKTGGVVSVVPMAVNILVDSITKLVK